MESVENSLSVRVACVLCELYHVETGFWGNVSLEGLQEFVSSSAFREKVLSDGARFDAALATKAQA